MLKKYTIDSTELPAGIVVTADIADAGVTPPKIKTKAVVALADAAATLTATQMIDSGIFTITPTTARILTTDTAANIVAGMSGYQVGTWFDITIVNTAAFNVTLAAGVGITLSGNAIINKASGTWRARIDSASAVTLYRMTYDLVDDAVTTAKILAKNVTTAKIADAAITPSQTKTKTVVALADAAATLTATQMIDSGIFTITPSVARILTTDTAVNIVAGLADYQVGTWFDITIVNTAAFDVTLAAGAGVTLSGNVIVHKAAGTWRARIDSATTVTLYRMGFNLEDGTVALAKIVNGTGLSLVGRSANSAGANADIVGTDGQVARVSGTALGFGTIAAAGIASDAVTTAKILDANVTEAKISASSGFGLGMLRTARAKYDFAVDGGAISTITPTTNATIPDNAIIVAGTINATTAPTSGGLATISFGTSAGSSATSLLGATAIATFTLDSTINSTATFAAPVKMTASGSITLTIAVDTLTAGIIEVTLLYFVAAA